jgi:hypothetical protein
LGVDALKVPTASLQYLARHWTLQQPKADWRRFLTRGLGALLCLWHFDHLPQRPSKGTFSRRHMKCIESIAGVKPSCGLDVERWPISDVPMEDDG